MSKVKMDAIVLIYGGTSPTAPEAKRGRLVTYFESKKKRAKLVLAVFREILADSKMQ